MFVLPLNSYVETVITDGMVLGGGPLREYLSLDEVVSMVIELVPLQEGQASLCLSLFLMQEHTQRKGYT